MTAPANFGTANRIIRMAMEDAGLLQDGDDPTSGQYAKNLQRLNDMVNLWQTQGLKLFLWQDIAITLVAGTGLYTLGPLGTVVMVKPLRVLQAYFLDTAGNKTPLTVLSWDEYLRLSNTTINGSISQYFVDKQKDLLNVYFYNKPDATAALGSVHLLVETQSTQLINLTDAMVFPPEWFIALRWGLADELATGQPASIVARCQQKATMFREALEDWDVEDTSVYFAADVQGTQNNFN